jgi:NADH-quinone oxidoreductase subunit J
MSDLAGAPAGGMAAIAFWIAAAVAVVAAIATVVSRRAIRSALFLLGNILAIAVMFALLDAHMLAALQVIVYAGAVVVLFVFVIMLMGTASESRGKGGRAPFARIVGGAALLWVGWVLVRSVARLAPEAALPEGFGTVHSMAQALFVDNVLTVEAVSVLLLVAIVGAMTIAKGRRAPAKPADSGAGASDA